MVVVVVEMFGAEIPSGQWAMAFGLGIADRCCDRGRRTDGKAKVNEHNIKRKTLREDPRPKEE